MFFLTERSVVSPSGTDHARTGRCWQQQSRLPHGTSRTPLSTTQPQSAQLTFMVSIVTAPVTLRRRGAAGSQLLSAQ